MALPIPRGGAGRLGLDADHIDRRGRLRALGVGDLREVLHRARVSSATAGELAALVALSGVLRRLLRRFTPDLSGLLRGLVAGLETRLGSGAAARLLTLWRGWFEGPAKPDLGGDAMASGAAAGAAEAAAGTALDPTLFEDLVVFHLAESNPAAGPLLEVLGADEVRRDPVYRGLVETLHELLAATWGPGAGGSLLEALREPSRHAPDSLAAQLRWVTEAWAPVLDEEDRRRVLVALDVMAEESRPRFPPGPGPPEEVVGREALLVEDGEPEAYTADRSWMHEVVLVAKNAPVWLHQLGRQVGRELTRLDQIPEAELDRLAERGFNALWLIGIWQRSAASRRIKQLTGNPEAAGSAYSIRDYRIADELGGDAALLALRERAWQRGIRLGADMVPNHMGIDSRWVIEHPERFLTVERPPFPNYRFQGPDLSPVPWLTVQIEDHYYDRSDAAVVFRRHDHRTGEERFLYHGNDGTGMPWNDTAQLDYLRPETRSAVLATILRVAGMFPLVRFDAAMTLARRHYRRLWFPEPGKGGAIPSRAEHALTGQQFDRAMPHEFWREVVDAAAEKTPDTLLLAEAFWLMESYFVRTLGMHRVYNSAFMNMIRDRDNAGYRKLIRETLEYDPRILSRYVNFLTNPDERTAVDQFGRGDRYLGACTLLATLPGMPMFGHGQVEGFAERYGMEYRRSYWQEEVDEDLLRRHQERIFPLLRRRRELARTERFELYDFEPASGSEGEVVSDVFAFANGPPGGRRLVIFHNRAAQVEGRIRRAVPVRRNPEEDALEPCAELGRDLGLRGGRHRFLRFRDQVGRRDHLRRSDSVLERGLDLALGPYETRVLEEFREVEDVDGRLALLAKRLGRVGVVDLDQALEALEREPVETALRRDVEGWASSWVGGWQGERQARDGSPGSPAGDSHLARALRRAGWPRADVAGVEGWIAAALRATSRLGTPGAPGSPGAGAGPPVSDDPVAAARRRLAVRPSLAAGVVAWIAHGAALEVRSRGDHGALAAWTPGPEVWGGLSGLEADPRRRERAVEAARLAAELGWIRDPDGRSVQVEELLAAWWRSESVRRFVGWRESDGLAWVRRRGLRELVRWYGVFRGLGVALRWESAGPSADGSDPPRDSGKGTWLRLLAVVRRAEGWAAGRTGPPEGEDAQGPGSSGTTRSR